LEYLELYEIEKEQNSDITRKILEKLWFHMKWEKESYATQIKVFQHENSTFKGDIINSKKLIENLSSIVEKKKKKRELKDLLAKHN
jgi:hypothetical protein